MCAIVMFVVNQKKVVFFSHKTFLTPTATHIIVAIWAIKIIQKKIHTATAEIIINDRGMSQHINCPATTRT